jgi:hypothetical protein
VGQHRDRGGGHHHQPDGQPRDRQQVAAQVAEVGVQRRPVQQRRQEQRQRQLRVQLDLWQPGDQGDGQAGGDQQHRLGDAGVLGEGDHHRDGGEHADEQLQGLHDAATVAERPPRRHQRVSAAPAGGRRNP